MSYFLIFACQANFSLLDRLVNKQEKVQHIFVEYGERSGCPSEPLPFHCTGNKLEMLLGYLHKVVGF